MNYVSYFYTKQLHTLSGMYLIFSLSVSFVIFILVMLITLQYNGLIAKLSSFLGSFALSFPFIILMFRKQIKPIRL